LHDPALLARPARDASCQGRGRGLDAVSRRVHCRTDRNPSWRTELTQPHILTQSSRRTVPRLIDTLASNCRDYHAVAVNRVAVKMDVGSRKYRQPFLSFQPSSHAMFMLRGNPIFMLMRRGAVHDLSIRHLQYQSRMGTFIAYLAI